MSSFILATMALIFSGLFITLLASVGFSMKEADKAIFTQEIDSVEARDVYFLVPVVVAYQFVLDCNSFMWSGIKMLFSSGYRADMVMTDILLEESEEEVDE